MPEYLLKEPEPSNPKFSYCNTKVEISEVNEDNQVTSIEEEEVEIPIDSSIDVEEFRKTLIDKDITDVFNFVFPDGRMQHFRRRRAVMHRNPTHELFIRW